MLRAASQAGMEVHSLQDCFLEAAAADGKVKRKSDFASVMRSVMRLMLTDPTASRKLTITWNRGQDSSVHNPSAGGVGGSGDVNNGLAHLRNKLDPSGYWRKAFDRAIETIKRDDI
eukprot:TRINITY_DN118731_c0_g1_i1.p1 TRINITY_DN118731_c0_g1~~TRINITY_DN118731_c0_g1_i1.p1  ORF type:complete len:116 (-),score=22.76 TRINITY_DN118731_c0_g1_i1:89-436(-)